MSRGVPVRYTAARSSRASFRRATPARLGDEWRVRLKLSERGAAEPCDHPRVLELRGTPPPQYAALDD
jgi:hypothetical protein